MTTCTLDRGTMAASKNINIFTFLLSVAMIFAMGARHFDNTALRLASYISECSLIIFCLICSNSSSIHNNVLRNKYVIIVTVLLTSNYIISPNNPVYSDLLKFFGYLCCFKYGNNLSRKYESINASNNLLFILIVVPLLAVAFLDNSLLKNSFFKTPNGFVYTGVSMGLFFLILKGRVKKYFYTAIIIVACYILICTSLGVVAAAVASFLLLNLKRTHIPYLLVGGTIIMIVVFYVDIPLFVRIRDVIAVWKAMTPDDWKNIEDISTLELSQRVNTVGERTDTTSSIWRLAHWVKILKAYLVEVWSIPFGLGAGYAVEKTGNAPHNDYLLILSEYGLVVFSLFLKMIKTIYRRMKSEGMLIYFILTMFIYHFTENLIDNFPPNAIFYF